ncbi:type II secretion system protein [Virgibacillus doumboii]|uniref:type II secretion system protein n=1 Tax=Virgibacillus doumboii TaxID=2697503 RepID=UPI0013E0B4B0|nr:type II secretion system protein [Virgibacillus doumboii]
MSTKLNIINNKGFTLIEIIASIAILGMVITVFLPIFPQILSWNEKTDDELVASNLLGQAVHDIKENYKKTGTIPELDYTLNNETYNVTVELSQTGDEADLGLQRVHITIISQNGTELSDTYSYLSQEGVADE